MTSDVREGRQRFDPPEVGGFVHTAALGVGRLIGVNSEVACVRYFRAPGQAPYVDHEHPAVEVSAIELAEHTRAYVHDGRRWRIGRIEGARDPGHYLIAFPNQQGEILPVDSFDVRWRLPIANPFELLQSVGGDSPIVYEARLSLLSEWSLQRAAAVGVEGLVLGSVELHRHQLEVVRQVTSDPVIRYILADEVGLGKTIEAAAIIWQFLSHRSDARVLVLAPDHLREQWSTELRSRFRIEGYRGARIWIRSQSDEASWPSDPVDLLVIDEAHHVTRTGALAPAARARVAQLAHTAESLLLLTATPVRSNEAGFLDLLYLLDPEHYDPNQVKDFTRRVELRDQLALTYKALLPDIDEFDLSLYSDELRSLFPEDAMLAALLTTATAANDIARSGAVARVREHLSSTYRLHHRLLRTRRTAELAGTFSVRGRKRATPFTLDVDDRSDALRRELLDSVRIHLTAAAENGDVGRRDALSIFRDVAQRCGSLSHALLPLIDSRHSAHYPVAARAFRDLVDKGILPEYSESIMDIHNFHESVVDGLGDVLSRVTIARGIDRTVISSTFTECIQPVAEELAKRWGPDRIATHLLTQSRDQNAVEVARWRADGPCSLLLCDSGAEEGINLQEADRFIHLDLPWECFRVEQRIGRCDRHAPATRGPIPSMVVAYGDQSYALGWIEFLADGCDVFTRSVSSLQYVLSDTERAVQAAVMGQGPRALVESVHTQAAA